MDIVYWRYKGLIIVEADGYRELVSTDEEVTRKLCSWVMYNFNGGVGVRATEG